MTEENTTSITNLPNSSNKEDDLVNKILNELEDDTPNENETEQLEETLQESNFKIDKLLSSTKKINVDDNQSDYTNNTDNINTKSNLSFDLDKDINKSPTFLKRLFPHLDVYSLYEYIQLSFISIFSFLLILLFTPKLVKHLNLNKFTFLFNTTIPLDTISLSRIGLCIQSLFHGIIFFVVSFILLKK